MKLTEITNQFLTKHAKIKAWLDKMEIKNYKIAPDGKVSVEGNVEVNSNKLTSIPVQFEEVSGRFICNSNKLESLVGCPTKINRYFDCSDNELTSLTGCPSKVGSSFYCNENKLTSLVGCPTELGGAFACNNNELESLAGCPTKVGSGFYCNNNKLTSLVGISDLIKSINGHFIFDADKIKTGGLGLLLIEDIQDITAELSKPFGIIKKYLGHPDRIFECQEELIENGFEEYAQL